MYWIFIIIIFSGNILITITLSVVIISINIYFVIYQTITNFNYNLALLIGVIVYSTIYLLMCIYLTLHLVISMLDDCSVLRRNAVSIYFYIPIILYYILINNHWYCVLYYNFQFVIKFIGPQIGNNFSQHQQTITSRYVFFFKYLKN